MGAGKLLADYVFLSTKTLPERIIFIQRQFHLDSQTEEESSALTAIVEARAAFLVSMKLNKSELIIERVLKFCQRLNANLPQLTLR